MATNNNLYWRRQVAEISSKPCWICYKPTSCCLATPDSGATDFFYICPGHLTDSKFAIAKDAIDLETKKRDAEIEAEIQLLKKEFDEKMKKKLERRKNKEAEKAGEKPEKEAKKEEVDDEMEKKEQEEKLKGLEKKKEPEKAKIEGPRIFELHKQFYTMRLQKKSDAEQAKRRQQVVRSGGGFPIVPRGDPGAVG
ncbi:UPF0589 protein [Fulvia fulva]|uniref:UPF0589 protein n=1 Tax=Passalora fulva TaxID=5499 RepID=A0A9Q8UW49_PASFU|nr:UPF0589 protein [Fulvia fulva]KAK4610302.1 UPF0589 protein [Fulvia fulva]KAK4611136.1 UPF0589 protein [Fulvia fulva]UJO24641.1 UPF0589 protein [Fulvia fulva]WPV22097.1 UPF0589 protein [Fulvia fulva]WPV37074.1 UPF0589 protein [Fulvia fulva]